MEEHDPYKLLVESIKKLQYAVTDLGETQREFVNQNSKLSEDLMSLKKFNEVLEDDLVTNTTKPLENP